MRSIVAAAVLLALFTLPAAAAPLEGFGVLRFGMSHEQAIAALHDRQGVELEPAGEAPEQIVFPVLIDGQGYRARAFFEGGAINHIKLWRDMPDHAISGDLCVALIKETLDPLVEKYGKPDISRQVANYGGEFLFVWERGQRHIYLWSLWDGLVSKCRFIDVSYHDKPFDRADWKSTFEAKELGGSDNF